MTQKQASKYIQELYTELGLKDEEYTRIDSLLKRPPSELEIRLFAAMWSEHCSYKRSRYWLKELPTEGSLVLQGPGEGAGIVRFDQDLAVAFKMESHNHPSAVEPFQGAATGVGGIIRDIVSMGARPIAILDCLRFSTPKEDPRHHYLLEKVVEGIAWYGNCIGVPTVGGDLQFSNCYQDNPLVNVMAVGFVDPNKIVPSLAKGEGNVLILYGAATGREGLHGATFASQDLDPKKQFADRSSVQIGDPFLEKLVIEATLELAQQPYVIGIQDLGAAGVLCATSEMAAQGKCGISLDLKKIHVRENDMKPWEILLSETQERMMLCVPPEAVQDAFKLLSKWELPASVVGKVISEQVLSMKQGSEKVLDISISHLIEDSIEYQLPYRPKEQRDFTTQVSESPFTQAKNSLEDLQHCSRKWVYEQFDYMVGCQTLVEPGSRDAAVIKPHNKDWGLAITTGGMLDSERAKGCCYAATSMIAECTRDLISVGAQPYAITNSLNFASPERPDVYEDFVQTIQGMKEACLAFETPVTGGNVSFYNQSQSHAIAPTPLIGMIGKIHHLKTITNNGFSGYEEQIAVVGPTALHFSKDFKLSLAKKTNDTILSLLQDQKLQSCRAISSGGIWKSLVESALSESIGAELTDLSAKQLFQEGGHRFLISCETIEKDYISQNLNDLQIPFHWLGKTIPEQLKIQSLFSFSLQEAHELWTHSLENVMDGIEP